MPDVDEVDDAPGHLIEQTSAPPRIWRPEEPARRELLSDQAETEHEADFWAELWDEKAAYNAGCDPLGTSTLAPLLPWALKQAALSFPAGTGLGADQIAPRAYARLSDHLLRAFCSILMAIELAGSWPQAVQLVIIVLLLPPTLRIGTIEIL